jgi:hypothetical protein
VARHVEDLVVRDAGACGGEDLPGAAREVVLRQVAVGLHERNLVAFGILHDDRAVAEPRLHPVAVLLGD